MTTIFVVKPTPELVSSAVNMFRTRSATCSGSSFFAKPLFSDPTRAFSAQGKLADGGLNPASRLPRLFLSCYPLNPQQKRGTNPFYRNHLHQNRRLSNMASTT